ncbi:MULTISPECIES: RepA leader peptide Tap [Cronobacter]
MPRKLQYPLSSLLLRNISAGRRE